LPSPRPDQGPSFDDGDDDVDPDEHEAASWLIDIAAAQLEEAGLITT